MILMMNLCFSSLFVDVWLLFVPTKCKMKTLNWWNHIWLDISFVDSLFFVGLTVLRPGFIRFHNIIIGFHGDSSGCSPASAGVTPLYPSWSHESQTKERCAEAKLSDVSPAPCPAGSRQEICGAEVARFKWSITACSSRKTKNLYFNRYVKIHSFCWTHDWKIVVNKNLCLWLGPVPKFVGMHFLWNLVLWWRNQASAFLSSYKKDVVSKLRVFGWWFCRCFGQSAISPRLDVRAQKHLTVAYQSHGTISPTGLSSIQEKWEILDRRSSLNMQ